MAFTGFSGKAQKNHLLICYKVKENNQNSRNISFHLNNASDYYLYSLIGAKQVINFYLDEKKRFDKSDLLIKTIQRGYEFINIDSNYKFTHSSNSFPQWKKEHLAKYTFLQSLNSSDTLLGLPCYKQRILDDLSDTITAFFCNRLPKESSLIFSDSIFMPVIKLTSNNYQICPEYIDTVAFDFKSIEKSIPEGLKIKDSQFEFHFKGASGFPVIGQHISSVLVLKAKKQFFQLNQNSNIKKTILIFYRGLDILTQNITNPKLESLSKDYQKQFKEGLELIIENLKQQDSTQVILFTSEENNIIEFNPFYQFLKENQLITIIPSSEKVFDFYHISGTPEVFVLNEKGELKDLFSVHFSQDNLTFIEFLKTLLN